MKLSEEIKKLIEKYRKWTFLQDGSTASAAYDDLLNIRIKVEYLETEVKLRQTCEKDYLTRIADQQKEIEKYQFQLRELNKD